MSHYVREGVHISGVGIFIILIVPVAYVRMEELENLTSNKQLRIICAGIWHNIVLVFLTSIIIFILPWICYPFYKYNNGIQIVAIHKVSFLPM